MNEKITEVETATIGEVLTRYPDSLVVTDEHLLPLLPDRPKHLVVLPPGETHKQWVSVEQIIDAALAAGMGRDGHFLGIGGGVICDMTAFAASIYMRGIRVSLVPTTLLAMVDASLGGKTGADVHQVKNIIGTFHPAEYVFIDTAVLSHLSDREFKNGLAELIKHGFLQGGKLLDVLKNSTQAVLSRDVNLLEQIVFDSLAVKRNFIEADPQERSGIRAQLNFGHTFGHALETLTGLSGFSHGEAVAWGMARSCEAGVLLGITEPSYAQQVKDLLRSYGFEIDWRVESQDVPAFLSYLSKDKKKQAGRVRFILQAAAGDTIMRELPEDVIVSVISNSQR